MTTEPTTDRNTRALPAVPVRWDTLTADAAQRELARLATWVAQLVERYDLDARTVPACWRGHGALVEELSALRTAWLSSYALTAPGNAPLAWHVSFAACRTRMGEYVARSGCTGTRHREANRGS